MASQYIPKPLFDTLEHLQEQYKSSIDNNRIIVSWLKQCFSDTVVQLPKYATREYRQVLNFLYSYRGSDDTFNSYRRELERFIQWSWFVKGKSLFMLRHNEIEEFIEFCQKPYKRWIGLKTVSKFINKDGLRVSNPKWRPFIAKISKKDHQDGKHPDKADYTLSQHALKSIFAILGSFYQYLIQEEVTEINPVVSIRQKSKFLVKEQKVREVRRLSKVQWSTVIQTAQKMAHQNPDQHERTLFIMNALYGMYLRISELAATKRWTPQMKDFYRDADENWWFKTIGKGNKARQIAVSQTMLDALKHWRKHLGLSPLPSPNDKSSLIPKHLGKGPISSTRLINMIVQDCFDASVDQLYLAGLKDESEMLRSATAHWLRHTGISDDVKIRPREHVRDDAGHSSSAITDRYIDIELKERAASARKKKIIPKNK